MFIDWKARAIATQADVDMQPEEDLYKALCSEAKIEVPAMSLETLKGLALRKYFKQINKKKFSSKLVYYQQLAKKISANVQQKESTFPSEYLSEVDTCTSVGHAERLAFPMTVSCNRTEFAVALISRKAITLQDTH